MGHIYQKLIHFYGSYLRIFLSRRRTILGDELITEIANIFGILRAAKMEAILSDFSQTGNRDDIIIHFYEPFLAAYNPKLKRNRGVYYTPESVVSYMVRSVDILLKDKFHKPLGLADPDVMILDPATGTGTYLLWIFQLVERRFKGEDRDGDFGFYYQSWLFGQSDV